MLNLFKLNEYKNTKKNFLCLVILSLFVFSCGKKEQEKTYVTFSNPGPKSCLSGNSIGTLSAKYPLSHKTLNQIHAQQNLNSQDPFTPSDFNYVKKSSYSTTKGSPSLIQTKRPIVSIINGTSAASSSQCYSGVTRTPNAQGYMPASNTVGIYWANVNGFQSYCSGAVIATSASETLIVTAAHCFNGITNFNDTSASGAVVYLGATVGSGTTYPVSCWQRNKFYRDDPTGLDDTTKLFDVAWVKVSNATFTSSVVKAGILTSTTASATQEKVMAGVGMTTDGDFSTTGTKQCVSTYADINYHDRGDIIPDGALASFNALTLSKLGTQIPTLSATPNVAQTYLTVIGPINGSQGTSSGSSYGTCSGDSGGPVYVYKSNKWVLSAITEGTSLILTPYPAVIFNTYTIPAGLSSLDNFHTNAVASCYDGYAVFTTLAPHVSWIESTSGYTLTKE